MTRIFALLALVALLVSPAGAAAPVAPGEGLGCVLTCPANQSLPNDPAQCGAVTNYPAPTTSGQCGTVTCSPPSGAFYPVGPTNVTCSETAQGSVVTVYSSGNVAVPIPASGAIGQMTPQVLAIADSGSVTDLNLRIRADHTFDADLEITLTAPDGTTSTLVMDDNGGSGDNLGSGGTDCSGNKTVFDDQAGTPIASGVAPFAGSFIPLNPLSILNGSPAAGNWTLSINDDLDGDSGTLFCWDLEITRTTQVQGVSCNFSVTVNDVEPPVITCPADISQVLPGGSTSAVVTFPDPAVSDNCAGVGPPTCVPPSGSTFPLGTSPVACDATDAASNTASCSFDIALSASSAVEVPALSRAGLALLALLVAAAAIQLLRRGA